MQRERKEGRRKRERETLEKRSREGERVPVLTVTEDSRGCAARGITYPTTSSIASFL